MKLEDYVTNIPDYPKKGIIFRDISGLIAHSDAFSNSIDELSKLIKNEKYKRFVCADARGFIFGSALAYKNNKGVIMARKSGKLPMETEKMAYELEYGMAEVEIEKCLINKGDKVVIVDDLLATGGTTNAIAKIVEKLGGEVAKIIFVIELEGLGGRELLSKYKVESLIKYKEEK